MVLLGGKISSSRDVRTVFIMNIKSNVKNIMHFKNL